VRRDERVEKGREQNTAEQHCCSCGRLGRSLGWYLLPGRLLRDWGRARHGTARRKKGKEVAPVTTVGEASTQVALAPSRPPLLRGASPPLPSQALRAYYPLLRALRMHTY